jgi:hypothetical protein
MKTCGISALSVDIHRFDAGNYEHSNIKIILKHISQGPNLAWNGHICQSTFFHFTNRTTVVRKFDFSLQREKCIFC